MPFQNEMSGVNPNSGNLVCNDANVRNTLITGNIKSNTGLVRFDSDILTNNRLSIGGPLVSNPANQPLVINADVEINGTLTASTCPAQASIANVAYQARIPVVGYNGVAIQAYRISSGNPGKNILFIHGFAHTNLMWKNQYADGALTTQHNVYAYDMRGQGESARPFTTGVGPADTVYAPGENHADDLNAVITTLGIAPCVVVAHSLGTAVLKEYIRDYGTGSLLGIILGAGEVGPVLGSGLTPALLAVAPLVTSPNYNSNVQGWAGFVNISSACTFDQSTHDTFMTSNSLPYAITGAYLSFYAGPRGGPPPVSNDSLYASITIPTMIVQGSADAIIQANQPFIIQSKLTSITPTMHIYPGIGHLFPLENYTQFDSDLLAWLGTF